MFIGTKAGLEAPVLSSEGKLPWISIAGADRIFRWAEVALEGPRLLAWNKEVPDPVAVRYAFTHNPEGPALYNDSGLPASPFRTDDWPLKQPLVGCSKFEQRSVGGVKTDQDVRGEGVATTGPGVVVLPEGASSCGHLSEE